jgi:glycosyltransferase involved in cell wall biosynthesis
MKASSRTRSPVLVLAWDRFQPRTNALGPALGGEGVHIHGTVPGEHPILLPLRYLADGVRMWRLLRRRRPQVAVVVTPPVVAPLLACAWKATHRLRLAIDCHTSTLHDWKWRWSRPVQRWLFRRVDAVLVHTEADQALLRRWGLDPLLLPDDLPNASEAAPLLRPPLPRRVLVAGSFAWDEPVKETLAAAALLPELEFRLTGDPARVPHDIRASAPSNVVFTGYLPYPRFLAELLHADVVAVLTTDPDIMNRAAFETVGLERPLVLSDLPQLRARFAPAAVFCRNDGRDIARAINTALGESERVVADIRQLRLRLTEQRETSLARLRSILTLPADPTTASALIAS